MKYTLEKFDTFKKYYIMKFNGVYFLGKIADCYYEGNNAKFRIIESNKYKTGDIVDCTSYERYYADEFKNFSTLKEAEFEYYNLFL